MESCKDVQVRGLASLAAHAVDALAAAAGINAVRAAVNVHAAIAEAVLFAEKEEEEDGSVTSHWVSKVLGNRHRRRPRPVARRLRPIPRRAGAAAAGCSQRSRSRAKGWIDAPRVRSVESLAATGSGRERQGAQCVTAPVHRPLQRLPPLPNGAAANWHDGIALVTTRRRSH